MDSQPLGEIQQPRGRHGALGGHDGGAERRGTSRNSASAQAIGKWRGQVVNGRVCHSGG
jgi:hypothetical protein